MDLGLLSTYLPLDRRLAIARGKSLPDRVSGAALFADISGFTPMTHAFLTTLGAKHGPEELTRRLNQVYDTLIRQTHSFEGSVIGFSGDALTCWFDDAASPPAAWRATACGLAMQHSMQERFAAMPVGPGSSISLALK
ncbi:MAG TPA: adenylate/guanylate cyclase domain-containing protein, partial [Anaerolineae bacterium]